MIDVSQGQFRMRIAGTPSANRTHTLPNVADDTIALLAAAQAFSNKTVNGPILGSPISTGAFGANQAIASLGTITLPAAGDSDCIQLNPAAAATGVIMTPGTLAGQMICLLNIAVAANTVTFAASGTSNVANGVTCVIRGREMCILRWSVGQAQWFPVFR